MPLILPLDLTFVLLLPIIIPPMQTLEAWVILNSALKSPLSSQALADAEAQAEENRERESLKRKPKRARAIESIYK